MTTRYLTGAYPAGYKVQKGVQYLNITSTASIGGYGLRDRYSIHIDNEGSVNATGNYGILTGTSVTTITNGGSNHAALIEGGEVGFSADGNATLNNFGTVISRDNSVGHGAAGVGLSAQATVFNGSPDDETALIQGSTGASGFNGGVITNYASIVGTAGWGAYSVQTVTNGSLTDRTASIQGAQAGVLGAAGGLLTNYASVVGGGFGAQFANGGTILNHRTISGTGASGVGVSLGGNPLLTNGDYNDRTALVLGVQTGVYAGLGGTGTATIVNYATIESTGAGGYGVLLAQGTLTNGSIFDRTALIQGATGVGSTHFRTLTNFGVIRGTVSGGLMIYDQAGVIINGSPQDHAALITGAAANTVSGAGDTVINYGTMNGLTMTGSGGLLAVGAQSSFGTGPVTLDGTLELMGGDGTLSRLSNGVTVSGSMATTVFKGFDSLQIGKAGPPVNRNAQFTLTGTGQIDTLTVYGRLTVDHSLTVTDRVAQTSTGVIALAAHSTAEFEGLALGRQLTVSFRGGPSLLKLTDPTQFGATIVGMVRRGRIDLVDIAADKAVLEAGDKLVITNQGQAVATLQLSGTFGSETFTTASDGAGGTFVSVVRPGGADPPASAARTPPRPAALLSAAAALGAREAGHAAPAAHAGYAHTLLAAPRAAAA